MSYKRAERLYQEANLQGASDGRKKVPPAPGQPFLRPAAATRLGRSIERQRRYRQKSVTVRASVLEAALATSSFDTVNYDVIGQLQAENDALQARVAELEAQLRNVTKKGRLNMDREISLLMLTVLSVTAWLVLQHFKVFPPTPAFIAFSSCLVGLLS